MKIYIYKSGEELYWILASSVIEAVIVFCIEYELDLSCLSPGDDISIHDINTGIIISACKTICAEKLSHFVSDYYDNIIIKPSVICSTLDIN